MSNDKLTTEEIEKFERYHQIVIIRIGRGESEQSAYRDKPEGYSEWVKQHFKDTGGIRLPEAESIPLYECWNCHKVYSGKKCPYCKAYKPKYGARRNLNRLPWIVENYYYTKT